MKNKILLIIIVVLYVSFLLPFSFFCIIILSSVEIMGKIAKRNLFKNTIKRKLKSYWLSITSLFFYVYFPKNIYLSFDPKILNKKRIILLSNHITYFDWIFVLSVVNRFNLLSNCIFTMKYSLKEIPVLGFVLKYFGNIFLKRDWNSDKYILDEHLKEINQTDFCIIIFPEGTFLDLEAKEDLKKFITNNGGNIKEPAFTLLPKKRGFKKIFNSVNDNLDLIVDFTLISKPFKELPAEFFDLKNILLKREPFKLSILIDSYQSIDEPKFLDEIFLKKEILLKEFSGLQAEENLSEFARNIYALTNKQYYYQILSLFSFKGLLNYLMFLFFMGFLVLI